MTGPALPWQRRLSRAALVAASCMLTVLYYVGPHGWPALGYAYVALGAVLGYAGLGPLRGRRGWAASTLIALFWVASTYLPRAHLSSVPLRVIGVLVAAAQLALVVHLLIGHVASWTPRRREAAGGWAWPVLYGAIPLAVWTSFILAYAPAKMTYDSFWQWGMAHHTKQYNDWHPFLHTLLIEGAASLYDSPLSYIVLQVLLASAAVAFALHTLYVFGAPRWLTLVLCFAYSAYPVTGFYAATMWKDVPFAYLVLASTTMLAWVVWTRGSWLRRPAAFTAFLVVGFLTMHVRSNGLPALLLALVVSTVVLRPARKPLLAVTAGLVALHVAWVAVVLPHFHVLRPPTTQALAIPTQQIGATYARGGTLTPDVAAYFNRILPADRWRADYSRYSVDPIKYDPAYDDQVVAESLPRYLGMWARLARLNGMLFVEAFADQTAAVWRYSTLDAKARVYVDTGIDIQAYPLETRLRTPEAETLPEAVEIAYREYRTPGCPPDAGTCLSSGETRCFGDPTCVSRADFAERIQRAAAPLQSSTRIPAVRSAHDRLLRYVVTDGQPAFARGAVPLLLLLLSLALAARRERRRLTIFGPTLAVIASVLAAMPATDLRYSFGWIVSVPFLLGVALVPVARGTQPPRTAEIDERIEEDPATENAVASLDTGAR